MIVWLSKIITGLNTHSFYLSIWFSNLLMWSCACSNIYKFTFFFFIFNFWTFTFYRFILQTYILFIQIYLWDFVVLLLLIWALFYILEIIAMIHWTQCIQTLLLRFTLFLQLIAWIYSLLIEISFEWLLSWMIMSM